MTYNAGIPVATNSPSVFPAQAQGNWTRLETIIGADHQFNASAAANDGYHNLVHLSVQAPSGALASTGRLYVKVISGLVQLFYMDDAGTENQVTPLSANSPAKIVGTSLVAGNASLTIFNVAYDYTGFAIVYINATSKNATYNFLRTGASTDIHRADENGSNYPTLAFSGTNLVITNNESTAQNLVWTLMINRVS